MKNLSSFLIHHKFHESQQKHYSHLSNKRKVTLTGFEIFHPTQKYPPPQNNFFLDCTKTV